MVDARRIVTFGECVYEREPRRANWPFCMDAFGLAFSPPCPGVEWNSTTLVVRRSLIMKIQAQLDELKNI